LGGQLKCD